MKKTYLKPETLETIVALQQLLAGTITGNGSNMFGDAEEGTDYEEADSRRRSIWDGEEY